MSVIAIDPGPATSGVIEWNGFQVTRSCPREPNEYVEAMLAAREYHGRWVVFEKVVSYGMAVGEEVFETVFWTGIFWRAARTAGYCPARMARREVKLHLCESQQAKDSNIWQALVDRYGRPGTKKAPGLLYGVSSHARAAMALAVTFWDLSDEEKAKRMAPAEPYGCGGGL